MFYLFSLLSCNRYTVGVWCALLSHSINMQPLYGWLAVIVPILFYYHATVTRLVYLQLQYRL